MGEQRGHMQSWHTHVLSVEHVRLLWSLLEEITPYFVASEELTGMAPVL